MVSDNLRPKTLHTFTIGTFLFLITVPVSACGFCGSFTTLSTLWIYSLLFLLGYGGLIAIQSIYFKKPYTIRLCFIPVCYLLYAYFSVDLVWILGTLVCFIEIVFLIKNAITSKAKRDRYGLILIPVFLIFPIIVVQQIQQTKRIEGIIFYPKYSDAHARSNITRVKGALSVLNDQARAEFAASRLFPSTAEQQFAIPGDPFSLEGKTMIYAVNESATQALFLSRGPDLELQIDPENIPWDELHEQKNLYAYDPTNGTASTGDLFLLLP